MLIEREMALTESTNKKRTFQNYSKVNYLMNKMANSNYEIIDKVGIKMT